MIVKCSTSVSYTHLDVYKRQAINNGYKVDIVDKLIRCLLYTSRCV